MTSANATRRPLESAHGICRGAWRGLVWYVKELMGDNDYAKYCSHLARHHPGVEPPSEREFWKQRWQRQATNPEGRCC